MTKPDWKVFVEIVGIAAIVASLVFVGLQLKQSQKIAIGAQYQERAGRVVDIAIGRLQSDTGLKFEGEQFLAAAAQIELPPELRAYVADRTPQELAYIGFTFQALMSSLDNSHFQYESGFLTEDSWKAARTRLKVLLAIPINREMYKFLQRSYPERFQLVAKEVIEELDSEAQ